MNFKRIENNQRWRALLNANLLDKDIYDNYKHYNCSIYDGYVCVYIAPNYVKLHRLILSAPPNKEVDHINRNRADNRRINLRLCNSRENTKNRTVSDRNIVGYKGVTKTSSSGKYVARIAIDNAQIHLGTYSTAEAAALEYNIAAEKYHKDFAAINILPSTIQRETEKSYKISFTILD